MELSTASPFGVGSTSASNTDAVRLYLAFRHHRLLLAVPADQVRAIARGLTAVGGAKSQTHVRFGSHEIPRLDLSDRGAVSLLPGPCAGPDLSTVILTDPIDGHLAIDADVIFGFAEGGLAGGNGAARTVKWVRASIGPDAARDSFLDLGDVLHPPTEFPNRPLHLSLPTRRTHVA